MLSSQIDETQHNPYTKSTPLSSVQDTTSLLPIPRSTPIKPPSTHTKQDNKILNAIIPVLFKLIPLLTVSVFERYQESAQFKIAEAECAALYENAKRSQMCNEVSKILDKEQSVKAPIIGSIIQNSVQTEMHKMRNRIKQSSQKIEQANKKLTQIRTQHELSKDLALSNTLKTKANQEQVLNSNPKSNLKSNPNPNQWKKTSAQPTPTPTRNQSQFGTNSNSKIQRERNACTQQPIVLS